MISMVTCIYNRADLLERTLASILLQEHKHDWEIIVVDDGSTDNLVPMLRKYYKKLFKQPKFQSLRLFRTCRDQYLNVAYPQNCGIKQAKGEYILYCSPEVMHRGNAFDVFHDLLEAHNTLYVARCYHLTKVDNEWLSSHKRWRNDLTSLDRFKKNRQLPSVLRPKKGMYYLGGWRKDSYIRVGGMAERLVHVCGEDMAFWATWKEFGFKSKFTFTSKKYRSLRGYHQWHPRLHIRIGYKEQKRHSRILYEKIKTELNDKVHPANYGKEWGRLPENSEVCLA